MSNPTEGKSRQLLRDIEAQFGRLRLDQDDFLAEHGDPAWDETVMGGRPPLPVGTEPIVKMFDTANLQGLRKAASVLAPEHINVISCMTMGWTSIPVLNACAVRRGDAMGIALNFRLNNVLIPANFLFWQMLEGIVEPNADKARRAAARVGQLLTGANHDRLDETLAEVRPFADWEDYRWGIKLTQPQMLFVLLHEYGHMILGHLHQSDFWSGHPLTSNNVCFFTGS